MSQSDSYKNLVPENMNMIIKQSSSSLAKQVNTVINKASQNESLEDFKEALGSVIPNDNIEAILTTIVTSVHLGCFDFTEGSKNPYNELMNGNITIKNGVLSVNQCEGFASSAEGEAIASNDLTIINAFAKIVGEYNSRVEDKDKKFKMDSFSIDRRCYTEGLNDELNFRTDSTCDEAGSLDMNRFYVSIYFKEAQDYTISYDII